MVLDMNLQPQDLRNSLNLHQSIQLEGSAREGLPVKSRFAWSSVKGQTYDALRIMMTRWILGPRVRLVLRPCREIAVFR